MRLRYAGRCRQCGQSLPAGTEAIYVKVEGQGKGVVYCNEGCRTGQSAPYTPPPRAFTPPGDDKYDPPAPEQRRAAPAATPEALVRRHLDALWNELKRRA